MVVLLLAALEAPAAAQGPPLPHILFGNVTANPDGGSLSGVPVRVTNLRSGATGTAATDSHGFWQFDLSDLPGGFQPGDPVEVRVGDRVVRTEVSGGATQGLQNLSAPPALAGQERGPASPPSGDPSLNSGRAFDLPAWAAGLLLLLPAALALRLLMRKRVR